MLPTTQEYKISLMIGQDSFRTLEGVEVIPNPNYPDEPWYSTGGLAIVFKLKLKDKLYALKCFYTEANERQERLGLIAAYLKQNPSPYFMDFTYLENELWVETANDEGQGYPVVLMEWVEGKTLDNYLEQICTQNNTPALKNLYFQFCNLAWWLQQQPIAHGDIKHDNLIVTPDGKLKLIDYDGVFVPALRGRKANEMGSPCYQHPKRDAYFFDKNLDDFSLLVLQITLLALQHQPKLFTEHYNGDGIILKDTDYQKFAQSPIKTILWQLPEIKIPLLLSQLQGNLNNLSAIDLMPLLQDVAWINWLVDGQKDGKLELKLERQTLKELILRESRWRHLFIHQVCDNYPLNEKLIDKFKDKWYWSRLSTNKFLPWSIELIEKYEGKWNFERFSWNKALPWSAELIEKYVKSWEWESLSKSYSFPWSHKLLEKYREEFNIRCWDSLSENKSFLWSIALIEQGADRWDWELLSENPKLPWSLELIEKYEDKWNFESFSWNNSLPWSAELIEKYKDKWSWHGLGYIETLPWSLELIEAYENKWDWGDLSSNKFLPWSIELIERYKNRWDWKSLSSNKSLPWSINLIKKYEDTWDWDGRENFGSWGLSGNEGLPWSFDLIEKYKNRWVWYCVSANESIPWTFELIEMYQNNLNWAPLSNNKSLPWSLELIEKYDNKWSCYYLQRNQSIPWSLELIEKYDHKWDWKLLSENPKLPWSFELIEKYEGKWNMWSIQHNEGIYEKMLKPLLNDEFIDEIMSEISGTS